MDYVLYVDGPGADGSWFLRSDSGGVMAIFSCQADAWQALNG